MLTLKKVAVTGGLGAGKTTFCHLLEELGAFVVSADKIVHQLLSPQTDIGKKVIQLLGETILVEGELNHRAISSLVFQNRELLLELEKIVHPAVLQEIETSYDNIKKSGSYPLFIAEVPLLYEAKFEEKFDQVVVVTANESLCKERYLRQGQRDEADFKRRNKRLLPIKDKCKQADFVITNEGSANEFKKHITYIFNLLTSS